MNQNPLSSLKFSQHNGKIQLLLYCFPSFWCEPTAPQKNLVQLNFFIFYTTKQGQHLSFAWIPLNIVKFHSIEFSRNQTQLHIRSKTNKCIHHYSSISLKISQDMQNYVPHQMSSIYYQDCFKSSCTVTFER